MARSVLASGEFLHDRYRLDGPIAAGGMGEVWRATDVVLGRTVAVKMLREHLSEDPGFGARFRAEARTLAALHHPGVIEVYDYGEIDQLAYLVMPTSTVSRCRADWPPAHSNRRTRWT